MNSKALLLILAAFLSACSSAPARRGSSSASSAGKFYLNDGPLDFDPETVRKTPDAVPRKEPLNQWAMKPYTVLDKTYYPMTRLAAFRQEGVGSWYGRRYHGKPTSSGEVYDMFSMTAAHPTLPLPSYARVSNPDNGKSVVVRVNDRGPFLHDRVIDLSFAAAYRLGYAAAGSGRVVVESIVPD